MYSISLYFFFFSCLPVQLFTLHFSEDRLQSIAWLTFETWMTRRLLKEIFFLSITLSRCLWLFFLVKCWYCLVCRCSFVCRSNSSFNSRINKLPRLNNWTDFDDVYYTLPGVTIQYRVSFTLIDMIQLGLTGKRNVFTLRRVGVKCCRMEPFFWVGGGVRTHQETLTSSRNIRWDLYS